MSQPVLLSADQLVSHFLSFDSSGNNKNLFTSDLLRERTREREINAVYINKENRDTKVFYFFKTGTVNKQD